MASDDAAKLAAQKLLTAPFQLDGMQSWALFLIGSVAGILGMIDAWWWEDPYPQFSRVLGAWAHARDDFQSFRIWCVEQLQGTADEELAALKDALRQAEQGKMRRPELTKLAIGLQEDLELHAHRLAEAGVHLLSIYREANGKARKTSVPDRFRRPPQIVLSMPALGELGEMGDSRQIEGLLTSAISSVGDALEESCSQLPTLSEWPGRGAPA